MCLGENLLFVNKICRKTSLFLPLSWNNANLEVYIRFKLNYFKFFMYISEITDAFQYSPKCFKLYKSIKNNKLHGTKYSRMDQVEDSL